jgi:hypothetical protein
MVLYHGRDSAPGIPRFQGVTDGHWMPHPVRRDGSPELHRALATRDSTVPDAPGVRATGKRRVPRPLAVVAPALLVVGLLRCPVTIDDHAAGLAWIAGTIAATSLGRRMKGVFALRPYQPSARRVYQPAVLP